MTPAPLRLDLLRAVASHSASISGRVRVAGAELAANDRHLGPADVCASLPGRARGKVVLWAMERLLAVLDASARRGLVFGESPRSVPTADERALLRLLDAVARRDGPEAHRAALWLVPEARVDALLRAARGVLEIDEGSRLRA